MEVAYHPLACTGGRGTERDGNRRLGRRASSVDFAKQSHKLVYRTVGGNACRKYQTIQVLGFVICSVSLESSPAAAPQTACFMGGASPLETCRQSSIVVYFSVLVVTKTQLMYISIHIYRNGPVARAVRQLQ